MTKRNKEQEGQDKIENTRVGYQVATNLWIHEDETLWSKFNALLMTAPRYSLLDIRARLETGMLSPSRRPEA